MCAFLEIFIHIPIIFLYLAFINIFVQFLKLVSQSTNVLITLDEGFNKVFNKYFLGNICNYFINLQMSFVNSTGSDIDKPSINNA